MLHKSLLYVSSFAIKINSNKIILILSNPYVCVIASILRIEENPQAFPRDRDVLGGEYARVGGGVENEVVKKNT